MPIPAFLQPFHRTVGWLIPKAPSFSFHLCVNKFHSLLHHPQEYFPRFPSWSALTLLSLSFGSWTAGLQNLWIDPWRSLRSRRWQRTQCPSLFSRTRNHPCIHRSHSATSLLPGTIPAAVHPSKPEGNSSRLARTLSRNLCFQALLLLEFSAFLPCRFSRQLEQGGFWDPSQPKAVCDPSIWVLPYGLWAPLATGYFNLWQNKRENTWSRYFTRRLSCLFQAVSTDTHSEFRGCRILILTM